MGEAAADGAQFFEPGVDMLLFLQHVALFLEAHFFGDVNLDADYFVWFLRCNNRDEHVVENGYILGFSFADSLVVVVINIMTDFFAINNVYAFLTMTAFMQRAAPQVHIGQHCI